MVEVVFPHIEDSRRLAEISRALVRTEDVMDTQNRKHGRKSGGHKHGGTDMKKASKGRKATKKGRSARDGRLTLHERDTRALAEATPLGTVPVAPPPAPSPQGAADMAERASVTAPPAVGSPETEAFRRAIGVGPVMRHGMLAVIACVMVAICGVALVRACEANETPTENDAADSGSCSDDASMCVARA